MSIEEKALRKELSILEKKKEEYEYYIFECDPLTKIIENRLKAQEIFIKYKGDNNKIAEKIKPLAKKEKELLKLQKKKEKYESKTKELSQIIFDIGQLKNRLFILKNKR
jgi:hypothetical protein